MAHGQRGRLVAHGQNSLAIRQPPSAIRQAVLQLGQLLIDGLQLRG